MAKELPYFKFFVSEWFQGDITLETMKVQGVFVNVCAYYWSKLGEIDLKTLQKRFKNSKKEIQTLVKEGFLTLENESEIVRIKFLDEQINERNSLSIKNKENAMKRWGNVPNECDRNATASVSQCQSDAIKNKSKNKKKNKKGRDSRYISFVELFNQLTQRSFKGDNKSERAFIARFKEGYDRDQFTKAINNAKKDPYHIETGFKYLTPEYITRPDQLEKWLNVSNSPQTNQFDQIKSGNYGRPVN